MPQLLDAVRLAFQYPLLVHVRRHGPLGYSNYRSYKPWLRDDFQFRCVYCLWRERWRGNARPDGIADSCHERARRGQLPAVY